MRIRTLLMGALAAVALVAVLLVAGVAAISFGWQRERVRAWLETQVAEATGAEVTIAALEGPLHDAFVLRDLRVVAGEQRLLTIQRGVVTIGSIDLWPRPRLVISAVEIDAAELDLQRDAAGAWNFAPLVPEESAASEAPPPGPPWLEVRRVEVRDGRLVLRLDAAEGATALTTGYTLEARDLAFPSEEIPPIDFVLTLEEAVSPQGSLDGGTLRGQVSQGRFELAEGRLHGPGFTLEAEGSGTLLGVDSLQVVARIDDLAVLTAAAHPDLEARGALVARGELRGTWEQIAGELSVTGSALALRGEALGELDARIRAPGDRSITLDALQLSGGRLPLRAEPGARVRLEDGTVAIEGLRLASGEARLALDGRIGADHIDALRLQAEQIDPAPLAALAGSTQAVGGRLAADLVVDGSFTQPEVTGRVRWNLPRIGELRFDLLETKLETRAGILHAEFSGTTDGAAVIVGRAELPRQLVTRDPSTWLAEPAFALELTLQPLAIERLAPLLPESLRGLDGRIEGALAMRGGTPWPRVRDTTLVARGVARPGETPRDIDLAIVSEDDGAIRVETLRLQQGERQVSAAPGARLRSAPEGVVVEALTLLVDGQRLELSGGLGARGFDGLRLRSEAYDPASLVALLGVREPIAGKLDIDLELAGGYDAPSVSGRFAFTEARIGATRFDRLEVVVETPDDRIRAEGTLERGGRKLLDLRASAPRALAQLWPDGRLAAETLELALEADDLELALFAPLLSRTLRDPVGTVRGRLRFARGRPEGSLEIAGGGLTAPGVGRLEPIVARLQLDDTALTIQHFRIGGAEGDAKLTGRIDLVDLRPTGADLALVLDRFAVSQPGLWQGTLSGSVDAVGPLDKLVARGALVFGALRVEVPSAADPALKEIRIVAGGETDAVLRDDATPGLFEHAAIDLRVEVPENSWVRGGGAELEIAGKLQLTKQPLAALRYDGAMKVVRGTYRLHGKRFELRKGRALLVADTELDPELDVVAAYRVADVTIVARVTGRASAPEVRLESEPALPDADVLAYLLFGRSAAEVSGGAQVALASAAAQAAAGVAAGQLETLLTDVLPVDTVDIRIQENGGLGELGVGKYLGDKIFVRYGRGLGVEAEDRVGVEVELTPTWSLESDVSSSGSAGADLIWRRDY